MLFTANLKCSNCEKNITEVPSSGIEIPQLPEKDGHSYLQAGEGAELECGHVGMRAASDTFQWLAKRLLWVARKKAESPFPAPVLSFSPSSSHLLNSKGVLK